VTQRQICHPEILLFFFGNNLAYLEVLLAWIAKILYWAQTHTQKKKKKKKEKGRILKIFNFHNFKLGTTCVLQQKFAIFFFFNFSDVVSLANNTIGKHPKRDFAQQNGDKIFEPVWIIVNIIIIKNATILKSESKCIITLLHEEYIIFLFIFLHFGEISHQKKKKKKERFVSMVCFLKFLK
jgi:hypothetical protein